MPRGRKSAALGRRVEQMRERRARLIRRAADFDVVVEGDDDAAGEGRLRRLEDLLQRRREAQPAGGAPLRAAAAREEAHPAYRAERGDVGRHAVS